MHETRATRHGVPALPGTQGHLGDAQQLQGCRNYKAADLRKADLGQVVSLDGIRWTASTRWPKAWTAEIERRSVDIGGGVFEIREGTGVPLPA